ncbi:FAD-dependent monooxygenase [Halopseudomonas phragmitis]|uniref:2-octaprenyl-3-methyl-6-methoxy-1,4-benzoquinol hydroxylase n=2 Tax=Pseudomonadaceae TaxID=135621 RepID=A0A1V0B3W1_9GAMM|nr:MULTISPECIES: FAD-dependent monooxygenase [Pseudomonadaceae]AQZ94580.1 2-octaprenyl-3-methyl-6-methoxy-1,4-benzoquinol hydroxylase [Halopseudomonas phragmitis]RHW22215.1 2-octaprenyl-3-methyl-6-methoxy-1,4-benzoquinol hydroxylase [Pseudomonas jilinensis]
MNHSFDLIVVGAGMVGAAVARALADTPLRIAVLDALPREALGRGGETGSGYDPRVSALSAASQRILSALGAWQRIAPQRRCAYSAMRVWDAEGTGEIGFDAAALHETRLGHIVENHLVQQALLDSLDETRVELFFGQRVQGLVREESGWRLNLADGLRLSAPLLIAADGARSQIRELAGFAMREWDYLHHALVTTVQLEQPHQATAWQRFLPTGPLAFLPLPDVDGRHYCSIVWSLLPEQAEQMMALDEPAFCAALGQAIEGRLGRVLSADRRHCIPLRQRHARQYAMPGLVLVGDAAHSIHPLAGQGVNLGFLDAAELAEVLLAALRRGESLAGLAVLQRYERRRMADNLAMMAAMEGFERLFHADAPTLRWVRNAGMRWLDNQPLLKSGLIRRAMGLSGDLPALARDPEIVSTQA